MLFNLKEERNLQYATTWMNFGRHQVKRKQPQKDKCSDFTSMRYLDSKQGNVGISAIQPQETDSDTAIRSLKRISALDEQIVQPTLGSFKLVRP